MRNVLIALGFISSSMGAEYLSGADFIVKDDNEMKSTRHLIIPCIEGRWKHVRTGLSQREFSIEISRDEKNASYHMKSTDGLSYMIAFSAKSSVDDNVYFAWAQRSEGASLKQHGKSRRGTAVLIKITGKQLVIEPFGNQKQATIDFLKSQKIKSHWDTLRGAIVADVDISGLIDLLHAMYQKDNIRLDDNKNQQSSAIYEREQ